MLRLCVLGFLLLVAVMGCRQNSSSSYTDAESQEIFDRQVKAYDESMERGNRLLDDEVRQNERLDKLLDKWEEQARRQDAILSKQEKQLGIE